MTLALATIIVLAACIVVIAWLITELRGCDCGDPGPLTIADPSFPRMHKLPPVPDTPAERFNPAL